MGTSGGFERPTRRHVVLAIAAAALTSVGAEAQHRRRARGNYDDLVAGAQTAPQGVAGVTAPFFDDCRAGTEFDQRRCVRGRPSRRRAASGTLWQANFFASNLVRIGRYDFSRRRFEVTVGGILTGPLVRRGAEALGYLSTAPTRLGRLPEQTLLRQYVTIADEGLAEQWRRRNADLQQLRVGVVFRLGGGWSDTLADRVFVWNARSRRNQVVSRRNVGMLMRVVGVRVFHQGSGEVLAQFPSGPSARAPEPDYDTQADVEEQADPESFAPPDPPPAPPAPPPDPPPAPPAPPAPPSSPAPLGLSLGTFHACARTVSGEVRCWGSNQQGQLGDGTRTARLAPTLVPGLVSVTQVACGYEHTCALRTNGTARCWGNNLTGQLGDGTGLTQTAPAAVVGLTDVAQLALGRRHTCARLRDGAVRCWGINEDGQIGDGTDLTRALPTAVPGLAGVQHLAAGAWHTCAVLADRTVRCWGDNESGQLGDGTTEPRRGLVAVAGLTDVVELSLGTQHSCARRADGAVLCWGEAALDTQRPLAPTLAIDHATQVAAGGHHTCAVLADGTVRCWGDNGWHQLGDGTRVNRGAPTPVTGLSGVLEVAAGRWQHTCARTAFGLFCWGSGGDGEIGDGQALDHAEPAPALW